ncbi:unnamed protein product, partial [Nesidiocoris tenuis]
MISIIGTTTLQHGTTTWDNGFRHSLGSSNDLDITSSFSVRMAYLLILVPSDIIDTIWISLTPFLSFAGYAKNRGNVFFTVCNVRCYGEDAELSSLFSASAVEFHASYFLHMSVSHSCRFLSCIQIDRLMVGIMLLQETVNVM